MDFDLQPSATRVRARLELRRGRGGRRQPLVLDGVRLKLISVSRGRPRRSRLATTAMGAESSDHPRRAARPSCWRPRSRSTPRPTLHLEGLYMSGGRFCTQCEAEGFRKITFFPRPARTCWRATPCGWRQRPGPIRACSPTATWWSTASWRAGRHFAVWNDPFPKPCYLFAAVAGELDELADSFVTAERARGAACASMSIPASRPAPPTPWTR